MKSVFPYTDRKWDNLMSMIQGIRKFSRTLVIFVWGCSALALLSQTVTIPRADVRVLGSIDYGQTSAPARLAAHPPYSAYSFNGRGGDHIEITVKGEGALHAILTNADYRQLAGGPDHFSYAFPAESAPGTYYILISEQHHRAVSFTVDLERPSTTAPAAAAVPEYLSCSADTDCVAVDRAGCCHNGYKDAVNTKQIEQYRAANACNEEHRPCPMFRILDKRVARCDTALKRCEMVNP
jgi:hypothetical protein